MSRKATTSKNTPFTAEMAETYFSAIKSDFDGLRSEMNTFKEGLFNLKIEVDNLRNETFSLRGDFNEFKNDITIKLSTVLSIAHYYDSERKEIRSDLWDHDKRLLKLEKV